ncbi:MAG: hypothetical protein ACRC2S_16250 [Waterburya sp.]
MPLNKISQAFKTDYLGHPISISESPDGSWSYVVHGMDYDDIMVAERTGFTT